MNITSSWWDKYPAYSDLRGKESGILDCLAGPQWSFQGAARGRSL